MHLSALELEAVAGSASLDRWNNCFVSRCAHLAVGG
jgi:hypothetical protein